MQRHIRRLAGARGERPWSKDAAGLFKRLRERRDSVDERIAEERLWHLGRCEEFLHGAFGMEARQSWREKAFGEFSALGRKRKAKDNNRYASGARDSSIGAGGYGELLATAGGRRKGRGGEGGGDWPIFDIMQPEVSLIGHSNSGKSTLLNALTGFTGRDGVAGVSDRAGWTERLAFIRVGRKPPLCTLVDMPGYGFAVADAAQKRAWKKMCEDYLVQRPAHSATLVLADATRGLCDEDARWLRWLRKHGVPARVVLTKADLLPPPLLAASAACVWSDLQGLTGGGRNVDGDDDEDGGDGEDDGGVWLGEADLDFLAGEMAIVSAASGAGVQRLWQWVLRRVEEDSLETIRGVRIHAHYQR